jgi:coniferyl-aldehyde dehydrogenase
MINSIEMSGPQARESAGPAAAADLNDCFRRIRSASRSQPAPDLAARRRHLIRVRDMVLDSRGEIADAIAQDFGGRARAETELLEFAPLMNGIRHALKWLPRWMKDERRHVAVTFQPARAWVRYEPLGVVGIISPWNYPLLLALAPLMDALAAGNRAMIKPSELTPRFSALLARLISECFESNHVTVVTGGADVGQAFSSLPFDHLIFTGSTSVGRHVMRAAAENLTPVTLELGGKSPAIVAPDYPLEKAARSISFGKFVNAGQSCIAPDYVLAPADQVEALARALLAASQLAYPAIQGNEQYSNIISERHRERLHAAVEDARARGARVLQHPDATGLQGKTAPTVVLDAPANCLLMTEEIFGPVLPIVPYRSLDEALAFVNERERPLALYCFTNDARTRNIIISGATSGGVTVNGTLMHIAQDDLPFGGIGPSGMGAYHGREGFRRFSHARAVHQIGLVNILERLGPPWGRLARMTARMLTMR